MPIKGKIVNQPKNDRAESSVSQDAKFKRGTTIESMVSTYNQRAMQKSQSVLPFKMTGVK